MPLRVGDQVTIQPTEADPLILHMQRFVRVSQVLGDACMVLVEATLPPNQEFGPIPSARLLPGWRDSSGAWRRW